MISAPQQKEYYQALVTKNPNYEGIFFAGITTTGIFCRPTCPARKPKFENCEYFNTAQDALLAGYRPCKRCHPLAYPDHASPLIRSLINAVEANPQKRWKNADFRALAVDPSTVRRQFKKRFGMTFVAYTRARRMGLALKNIRTGQSVIQTQLNTGYESDSGFRDAFSRIMGAPPSNAKNHITLHADWLDTKLGPMLAIADQQHLHLLEFTIRRGLEREIERLRKRANAAIIPGRTPIIASIQKEITRYFNGKLQHFKTPTYLHGSPFQQSVWKQLTKIPFGQTCSYIDLANTLNKPTAARAVATANGANQLAIIIPCHRVINHSGKLGGYSGGLARKQWLINHELNHKSN